MCTFWVYNRCTMQFEPERTEPHVIALQYAWYRATQAIFYIEWHENCYGTPLD